MQNIKNNIRIIKPVSCRWNQIQQFYFLWYQLNYPLLHMWSLHNLVLGMVKAAKPWELLCYFYQQALSAIIEINKINVCKLLMIRSKIKKLYIYISFYIFISIIFFYVKINIHIYFSLSSTALCKSEAMIRSKKNSN